MSPPCNELDVLFSIIEAIVRCTEEQLLLVIVSFLGKVMQEYVFRMTGSYEVSPFEGCGAFWRTAGRVCRAADEPVSKFVCQARGSLL